MGAEPYFYIVKYQPDVGAALHALRQREFKAGRYNPVTPFLTFPVDEDAPGPGAGHGSIEEALEEADADGTRSILDIQAVSDEPGFMVAAPFPPDRLREIFGTEQPSRAMVEANDDFFEDIERGHAVYIVLYADGKPDAILFAGYSFD